MFYAFLPNPTVFSAPALATNATYIIEIVTSLEVAAYRLGCLQIRLHAGVSGPLQVTILANKVLPFAPTGERFQGEAALTADTITSNTTAGSLVTSGAASQMDAAFVRIVASLKANGNPSDAQDFTISGGILLLP